MADILINTDNIIEITAVTDAVAAAALTSAVVKVTLLDASDDSQISGETWPLTMSHTSGGTYQAIFTDSLDLSPCTQCKAQFSIDGGPGLRREWETLYDAINGSIAVSILIDDTDHVLKVDGLEDALNPGTYLNTATVQVTLQDINSVDVAGEVWPLTLVYETASNGIYKGTLRDTLDVADGDAVKVLITADSGADKHREWRSILKVETGS